MRTLFLVITLLGLSASTAAVPVQAQAPAASPAAQPAAPGVQAPSEGAAALPRYTPPRTLRAYWHLFVAFAAAWVLLFAYTVSILRRFGRIERELEALRTG
jgi:CcmD family protein